MRNIFETSAEELEALRESARRSLNRRSEGAQHLMAWKDACRRFFERYDRLAFPGGLTQQFERLQKGDLEAIEMAVRFLEADPWYFRSV